MTTSEYDHGSLGAWHEFKDDAPTSQDLLRLYSQGGYDENGHLVKACGSVRNPKRFESLCKELTAKQGGFLFGQLALHLEKTGRGKVSLPYKAVLQLEPEFGGYEPQTTGDCRRPSSLVLMADGSRKRIDQIQVGDKVVSGHGNVRSVTALIKKPYSGYMTKVKVEGRSELNIATPDHQMMVYPKFSKRWEDRSEELGWKAIGELEVGDYLLQTRMPDIGKQHIYDLGNLEGMITRENFGRCVQPSEGKVRFKNSKREVNRKVVLDDKLGWLIGFYLAEGGICYQDGVPQRITLNICGERADLAETAAEIFHQVFDVQARVYKVPSKPTVLFCRLQNSAVAQLFAAVTGFGNTYTKTVPKEVFTSSRSVRLAVLRGWLDGDGHFQDRHISGCSVNKTMFNGLYDIANSLGLRCTEMTRPAKGHSKEAYVLNFYGDTCTDLRNYSIQLDKADYRVTNLGMAAKVLDIDHEWYEGDVHCIEVEHDHSFIADGFSQSNCVSHGTRNAGMLDYCIDALFGEADYKGRFATENIYGWRGHGGQGASCSDLCGYVSPDGPGGFLVRGDYSSGSNSVDLSTYNSRIGHNWGRRGTPGWLNKIAAKNKSRHVALITNTDELCDAIGNGYGVNVCSDYGFSSTRGKYGVARPRGSWSHAMTFIGCIDDSDNEAYKHYGERLFLIQNSWGDWISGPTYLDQPVGSFWVTDRVAQRMLNARGSWLISRVDGINRRDISYLHI